MINPDNERDLVIRIGSTCLSLCIELFRKIESQGIGAKSVYENEVLQFTI